MVEAVAPVTLTAPELIILLQAITLLVVSGVLVITARGALRRQRHADEAETARQAVRAAELLHPKGSGAARSQLKAETATRHVLEVHPGCTGHRARMLVEAAVAEAKK